MNLPKEISPNPLIASTVEIRFNPINPIKKEDIISVFYPLYSSKFQKVTEIKGVMQLGARINIHPLFFMFSNDAYSISFGTNVVSFENVGTYHLWDNYFKVISDSLLVLIKSNIIASVARVGVRYASIFENSKRIQDVFDLKIKIDTDSTDENIKLFQTEIVKSDITTFLQVAENARILKDNKAYNGVYIDVDVSSSFGSQIKFDEALFKKIDELHNSEKKFFYSLLNNDFLATLNPTY